MTAAIEPSAEPALWASGIRAGSFSIPYFAALLIGALLYFLAAELGLQLATLQENASPVWPASGIALALLIVGGPRLAPAVFIGAFAANAAEGTDLPVVLAMAVGNTLEAVIAERILRALSARRSDQFFFARTVGYFTAAVLAPVVSACFGVFSMALNGSFPPSAIGPIWLTWWMGDGIGILLLTPVLVGGSRINRVTWQGCARFLALAAATAITTAGAMQIPGAGATLFLLLAITLIAARSLGRVSASTIVLVMATTAIAFTAVGIGPFVDYSVNQSFIKLGLFLATIAFAGMIICDLAQRLSKWPITIFVFGCAVASLVFAASEAQRVKASQQHFEQMVHSGTLAIRDRLNVYTDTLRGGAGLFAASSAVTADEWRSYVNSLDLDNRYPGINGMGVVLPVASKDLGSFSARMAKDFTIHPVPGFTIDPVKDHAIVTMVEPLRANASALGLDTATEPTRFAAADLARRINQPTITGTVTLIQDENQGAGFVLYVPMYRETGQHNTFQGWIYAPLIAKQFFTDALGADLQEIDLRVYEGKAKHPVFVSTPPERDSGETPWYVWDGLETAEQIDLHGRLFTLAWRTSPSFKTEHGLESALYAAAAIIIATLLAALTANLQSAGQRAATELARANKRLNLIMRGSKDGIWHWDLQNDECWFSDRFKEILGYRPDEFDNNVDFVMSLIPPEEQANARKQFADLKEGRIDNFESVRRFRHTKGHFVTLHARLTSEKDEAGNVVTIAGATTDITAIKLSEQRLKDAVNVMQDGFGLFDADDRIVLHNDAFMDEGSRKLLGDDVTGRKFEEIVRAFAYHDMPADETFDREAWIKTRMERHNNPPKDAIEVVWGGGRVMRISERRTAEGGYVATWTDITELKRAEQRIKDAIGSLRDGFALFDADDRMIICNDAFLDPTVRGVIGNPIGLPFEDIVRAHATHVMKPATPDFNRESWIQSRMEAHRNPPETPIELPFSFGRYIQVSERRTTDGGYVGTWTDITAQIVREQQLRDAHDRLEQQASELVGLSESLDLARRAAEAANREKSQFLAHMSHELRTPLNAILGFSEMMSKELMGPMDNATYLNYAGIINSSGTHLLSLINDVLDISKIEAGKRELNIIQIPSEALASQSKGLVETLAKQRGVNIEATASEQCPVVQADERALRQILLNLLSNAIKFTPPAGKVSLRIEQNGSSEASVIVTDTGIGMNEDEVRIAMQPYGQIDSKIARQTNGTGLGLPLTKALTELHGGRLKIESQKGRGTTVTVTLPLAA